MSGFLIGPCGVAPAASVGGGGAGTVYTFDTQSQNNAMPAGATPTLTLSAIAANSLLVCAFQPFSTAPTATSVVDTTAGVTWTVFGRDAVGSGMLFYAFYPTAQAAGNSLVITLSASATGGSAAACGHFTGATSAQIDSAGTYVQGGATIPLWTTTATNTLLVGQLGPNSGTDTPTDGTWGVIGANFNGLVYKIASTTVSGVTPGQSGGAGYFGSVITAFK